MSDPPPSSEGLASPAAAVAPTLVARIVARRACQVAFNGMPVSEPVRIEVYAWLERLGELTAPMTAGRVVIEAVDRGHKEPHYRVRMDLTMPTGVVVVDYDHPSNLPHEDVYVAIRNAFRAARRQRDAAVKRLVLGEQRSCVPRNEGPDAGAPNRLRDRR